MKEAGARLHDVCEAGVERKRTVLAISPCRRYILQYAIEFRIAFSPTSDIGILLLWQVFQCGASCGVAAARQGAETPGACSRSSANDHVFRTTTQHFWQLSGHTSRKSIPRTSHHSCLTYTKDRGSFPLDHYGEKHMTPAASGADEQRCRRM